jgi:dTDP-4-dehydrorhamnose 3,5-epimerase
MAVLSDPGANARLKYEDFERDAPLVQAPPPAADSTDMIDGVTLTPLVPQVDDRGSLTVLMSTGNGTIVEPIVHVYTVTAKARSVRAWVYHRWQFDRLAYTQGRFLVALFDIRPDSPTLNKLSTFILGKDRPALLRIPPYVAHGVKNLGDTESSFINMPTTAYDPRRPDKARIPADDPRIPFNIVDA